MSTFDHAAQHAFSIQTITSVLMSKRMRRMSMASREHTYRKVLPKCLR